MIDLRTSHWLLSLILAILVFSTNVGAQDGASSNPARSFQELGSRVKPGDGIYLVDTNGTRVRGFLEGLTDSSLTLRVGDVRTEFTEAQVATVRRVHDSLKNGAVIGALVGAGSLGLLTSSWGPEIAVPWALVGAGIGAGAGLAIDAALFRGPTLYQKAANRVQLAPEIFGGRKAVRLSWMF